MNYNRIEQIDMSHTLEERIASLEQVIAEYERDLRNATSEERKDKLLDVIKARSEILARLLDEKKRADETGKFNNKICFGLFME